MPTHNAYDAGICHIVAPGFARGRPNLRSAITNTYLGIASLEGVRSSLERRSCGSVLVSMALNNFAGIHKMTSARSAHRASQGTSTSGMEPGQGPTHRHFAEHDSKKCCVNA